MKNYSFYTNQVGYEIIETKGIKKYYVTGYISTKDIDISNDIVTQECLEDMLTQLKSKKIKLDVEHEAYRDNPNIIPVGKIIEAYLDEKGIWVKAEMNAASPKFSNVWESVKNGFLDAFSITFSPVKKVMKDIQGKTIRLLQQITLLNVALTGNPINPEACIGEVFMKSLNEVKLEMEDEIKITEAEVEAKAKLEAEKIKADAETKAEEEKEEKAKVEATAEADAKKKEEDDKKEKETKSVNDAKIINLEKKLTELKAILDKPVFKAILEPKEDKIEEVKSFKTGVIDLIK